MSFWFSQIRFEILEISPISYRKCSIFGTFEFQNSTHSRNKVWNLPFLKVQFCIGARDTRTADLVRDFQTLLGSGPVRDSQIFLDPGPARSNINYTLFSLHIKSRNEPFVARNELFYNFDNFTIFVFPNHKLARWL